MAVASVLVGAVLALGGAPTSAHAAGSIVDGGNIVSDAEFFNGNAMTAAQVQTFIADKNKNCRPASGGPACLKDYRANLPSMVADRYCAAVPGKQNATAAEIIAAAGKACGVSQRVLLVMLQKEQSLVTRSAPNAGHYDKALGMSCPDTAPCDPRAAGFVNQVYLGARQQQVYVQNPNSFRYKPGQVNTIQWHPNALCGTSKVYIENQATANLYIYTPYRPNIAALAAGWGTGDDCSTYGNRNFYNYYSQWFSGAPAGSGAPAQIPACTVPPEAEIAARSERLVVNTASLNARTAPTTLCGTGLVSLASGTVVDVTGRYGAWSRATVNGKAMWVTTEFLTALVPGTPSITGNAVSGQVLTAQPGTWTPRPASFTYQWKRDGQDIPGATAPTYRVTNADATTNLSVTVTGSGIARTSAVVSARGFGAERLSGAERYETAARVSQATYPQGVETVYLVGGATFADALAAGPLAAKDGAALLLSRVGDLPAATAAELKRLAPERVVLVGGEGVLDRQMPTRIRALLGATTAVDRIGGADRYETARMVAARFGSSSTVYVVTGGDFADALGAAAVAGAKKAPVLLVHTRSQTIDAPTRATLTSLRPGSAVIVGGEGVVTPGLANGLKQAGLSVTRYGGINRYATNAALNRASFGSVGSIVLATGEDFPDALSGAVLAARRGVPIFVTRANCVEASAADFLRSAGGMSFTLVGGPGVLSADVGTFRRC